MSAKSAPAKVGGRTLEERHRLAGHVLAALDQELGRARCDPHAHAAAVRGVDELEQLLLGEAVVGDDQLVERPVGASAAETAGPGSTPPANS